MKYKYRKFWYIFLGEYPFSDFPLLLTPKEFSILHSLKIKYGSYKKREVIILYTANTAEL